MPITLYTEDDLNQMISDANRAFVEKAEKAIAAIVPDLSATAPEYQAAVCEGYRLCKEATAWRLRELLDEPDEAAAPTP